MVVTPSDTSRLLTIGLCGGIGAGKSAVAQAFARLGCAVWDADGEARAMLATDEIRQTLTTWWGDAILNPQGMVDRRAVARIVFSDPDERLRLEALIHPRLARRRERAMAHARERGVAAFVIDAPLLFEANLDPLCDVIVYVDASFRTRLDRVRRYRQWDASELRSREKSQLPLDDKRARSQYMVQNNGDVADVEDQVEALFYQIRQQHLDEADDATV
jgi:dephospho-CoA kinase